MRPLFLVVATAALAACNEPDRATVPTPAPEIRYGVLDVAAGDTLNMRASPEPSAAVVATIPHDGADVVATGQPPVGGWAHVSYRSRQGWVNARYLGFGRPGEDRLPAALECLGAEPFWGITLSPGFARAELVFAERTHIFRLTQASRALGRVDHWLIKGVDKAAALALTVERRACSDGMSDTTYPYAASATVPGADLLSGCCRPAQAR
jgi:uncharacterized membrane protein